MPTIAEVWPHDFKSMEKNRWQFEPVVATIARTFQGKRGPGYSFTEDDTETDSGKSPIWNMAGTWNNDTRSYDPYSGPTFEKGQTVKAWLSYRKYFKDDGTEGEAREIAKMMASKEQPAAPLEEHPVDTGVRTETAQTAPAQGQDMSDAEANLYMRLHSDFAHWLANKEAMKPWDFSMQAQIAAKAIERESIERQTVLKADAEIIAAIGGTGGNILGEQGNQIVTRYNRLADLLAHLPPLREGSLSPSGEPMPAAQPATDVTDVPWDEPQGDKQP